LIEWNDDDDDIEIGGWIFKTILLKVKRVMAEGAHVQGPYLLLMPLDS